MTLLRAVALSRNCCTKGSISVVGLKRSLRRLSTVGCLRTVKLLCLKVQLLRPHDLEETQHFSHWPQKKVAKIVGSKYPVVTSGAWRTFPSTAGDRDHCVGEALLDSTDQFSNCPSKNPFPPLFIGSIPIVASNQPAIHITETLAIPNLPKP